MPGTILVIRGNDIFSSLLTAQGLTVRNLPLIETRPVADCTAVERCLERLDEYDGVFVTSPAAAEALIASPDISDYGGTFYVVGARTLDMLRAAGVDSLSDEANSAEELISLYPVSEFAGKRFLFVRGDRSLNKISDAVGKIATIDELIVYLTVERSPDPEAAAWLTANVAAGDIEWVCFFSPSGVDAFQKLTIGQDACGLKTAVIGVTTAQRARELGYRVEYISPRASARDFAIGLASTINGN